MANAREVEVKFKIPDLKAIAGKLRSAGFQVVTQRTLERNTLYDLPDDPLRQRGALLRVRDYGGQWTFTFKAKGKAGRHKSRKEIETRVEDGACLSAILNEVGFRAGFTYEKFRTEWAGGQGHVVIDETPLGNFGEIEGPPRWIDATARRLGIAPGEYITDSYGALFLQWKQRTGSRAKDMTFAAVAPGKRKKRSASFMLGK